MERTIDDLFEKIYQSENLAQKRNNLKNELKQAVQQTNEQLKDLQEECLSLQGQLLLKQQKLTEEELKSKWLTRQEEIFREQKNDLQQQIQALQSKKTELEEERLSEQGRFCQELEEFSARFDLTGQGTRQRELLKHDALEKLEQEEMILKEELVLYSKNQLEIDQLSSEKQNLNKQLSHLLNKNKDLSDTLENEVKETLTMEEEKIRITNKPQRDPEFISLQRELSEAKSLNLEERCNDHQKEYQQLQQRLWQKKVQQRQQQLKQQQQQQLKQQQPQFQKEQQVPHKHQSHSRIRQGQHNQQASQESDDTNQFSQELLSEIFSDSDGASDQDLKVTDMPVENTINRHTFRSGPRPRVHFQEDRP